MIQIVEKFSKIKIKLSVPLISAYLAKGHIPADIARACNVSDQAVSKYIKKHYDELAPLVDTTDKLLAMQSKHLANKAQEKIEDILKVDSFNKKDLVPLNIVSGTHIDKYRLLSDKSTSNVSVEALDARIEDRDKRIIEVEARIKALVGSSNTGNQKAIETESGEEGIK
jgi:predicted DNA-binding protein YlxM (UPF0122 family)